MNSRALFLFFLVFLVMSCGTNSTDQISAENTKDSVAKPGKKIDSLRASVSYPKEMYAPRKSAFDEYFLQQGDSNYYCGYKGKFEVSDTLGSGRRFLFDLKAEYLVDKVFFYAIDPTNFFVFWQATDHAGVNSYAALYKRGINIPVWKYTFPDPNPGQLAVDGQFAYVTTLGSIGKMNMLSGSFVWHHDSLFDKMKNRYKEFDKPLVYSNTVCFFDFPIRGVKAKRDSIWVNDQTGAFIK